MRQGLWECLLELRLPVLSLLLGLSEWEGERTSFSEAELECTLSSSVSVRQTVSTEGEGLVLTWFSLALVLFSTSLSFCLGFAAFFVSSISFLFMR